MGPFDSDIISDLHNGPDAVLSLGVIRFSLPSCFCFGLRFYLGNLQMELEEVSSDSLFEVTSDKSGLRSSRMGVVPLESVMLHRH